MAVTSTLRRPPALRPGDAVGLVSPSGPLASRCPRRLGRAVRALGEAGFEVRLGRSLGADTGDRAGSARDRAEDLMDLVADDRVRAVFATVGGSGADELIPYLDAEVFRAHPTLLVGYSDFTSVLLWVHEQTGMTVCYGPAALPQFGEQGGIDPYGLAALRQVLAAPLAAGPLPTSADVVIEYLEWDHADERGRARLAAGARQALVRGEAEGPLLAANLSCLASTVRRGGPVPRYEGRIVLLEESDTADRDRLLRNLRTLGDTGLVERAAGIGFGRFAQTHDGRWDHAELLGTLARWAAGAPGPVVADLEFGHTDPMLTLPLGVRTRLTARDDVELCLLEAAVSP
ncbi:LD-carboxypeptidase [Streptomyces sp. NPDC060031]|uniref:S66 peptidase family protein n=1 Tax=Streptomyces sp. NPDC060031 TaxID=3347043 RepID=UPI003687B79D